MFEIGEFVVHRHRVCEIASVREGYFEGRDYFELRVLFEKSLKLFVAIDDAQELIVRPVMGKDQAEAFLACIPQLELLDTGALDAPGTTTHFAERQLKEEYERHMKGCGPESLAAVMKTAYGRVQERLEVGKRPASVDEKFFELTEGLLCDELSVALGISREDVRNRITERLA